MKSKVSDLRSGHLQRGFCPICLGECYCIKLREGGRQFGFKHVGDSALAIYGELLWDTKRAIYWHMSIEPKLDLTDSEVFSHFIDDIHYLMENA
jgi:hypothetical protein